jgi:uncharacterized protein
MEKSKVYFTSLKTKPGKNLLDKLNILMEKAGIDGIDFKDKFTAIKIHFGEPGNLAYIRPNYAAVVVKHIRDKGGRPFLTDANTLYTGRRANAVDHIAAAHANGFNSIVTGCDVIIADGLKGTDYREIPLDLKHCKTAKIGTAIADADIIVSMNHFKGHEMTGFGGAIKNIGMGSGARGGKLEMHSASKPIIKEKNCVSCGICIRNCSQKAISFNETKKAVINYELCIGCGQCVAVCQYNAAQVVWNESRSEEQKISEYTMAVLKGKKHFHINFVMNVSPNCDCWSNNDSAIVHDIGILASFDPVAIDVASVNLVNQANPTKDSSVDTPSYTPGADKFKFLHPNTNWQTGINHAVTIGLGSSEYEMIMVE